MDVVESKYGVFLHSRRIQQLKNMRYPPICYLSLIRMPNALYLINSPIYLNCPHKLLPYECHLLITFATFWTQNRPEKNFQTDLEQNCFTL